MFPARAVAPTLHGRFFSGPAYTKYSIATYKTGWVCQMYGKETLNLRDTTRTRTYKHALASAFSSSLVLSTLICFWMHPVTIDRCIPAISASICSIQQVIVIHSGCEQVCKVRRRISCTRFVTVAIGMRSLPASLQRIYGSPCPWSVSALFCIVVNRI